MAPIFSNSSKYLKSSVQNGTGIFVTEKQYLQWKPHLNGIKGRRVTGNWRNSNFPAHDHIWAKLRGFKRENNKCIRKGEKTKLHRTKIVVFWLSICGAMTRISSRDTPLWRHKDVFRHKIPVMVLYILSQKNYNFDLMQLYRFFPLRIHSLFSAFKTPLILTIYGHMAGNLNFFNYL